MEYIRGPLLHVRCHAHIEGQGGSVARVLSCIVSICLGELLRVAVMRTHRDERHYFACILMHSEYMLGALLRVAVKQTRRDKGVLLRVRSHAQ